MSLMRRQSGVLLPDITELWSALVSPTAQGFAAQLLRVEDSIDEKQYTVRAEIPGIDPAKDVQVSVHQGQLTIKAERTEKHEEKGRSEFNYGSFVRTVTLPAGAQEDGVQASYAKGILTVSVPLGEPVDPVRNIRVESTE